MRARLDRRDRQPTAALGTLRPADFTKGCSLSGVTRKTFAQVEFFRLCHIADLDQNRRSNPDYSSPVIRRGLAIGKRRFWSCPKGFRQQTGELSSASGMRT